MSERPDETSAIREFLETFPSGLQSIRRFVAPAAVWRHWRWGDQELVGREAIITHYFDCLDLAYGDYTFEVFDAITDRDRVVVRGRFRGEFKHAFHGVEATGGGVTWRAHDIYRFERGQIVEAWFGNDTYVVAQEMGIVPQGTPWPWELPGDEH